MSRPRILSISYSPLQRDARVLRQIGVLARHGDVTTLGYGEAPSASHEHLRLDDDTPSLPQTPAGVALLATRRLKAAELAAPGMKQGLRLLEGRSFDLVVANDARALPLAHRVAGGAPVWADMHEWAAQEFSHVTSWRLLVAPLMDHLCRTYLPRSAAVTTVCDSLADRYAAEYGVRCEIVRNAGPWVDQEPSPVEEGRLRLVHSGGAIRGRNLEMLVDVTLRLEHTTLDLYLVPAKDGGKYLRELHERAHGSDRVTIRDAVAPAELPHVLNAYDVGAFCMPPINVNAQYALPNKFFDFVQARLAVAVGPAIEMARLVREHDLGVVSRDFSADAFAEALSGLDAEAVRRHKLASAAASQSLSSQTDEAVEDGVVERLLGSR
ncbi:MAG: hypothetical protein ACTHN8_13565 [Angustibacter sp.]